MSSTDLNQVKASNVLGNKSNPNESITKVENDNINKAKDPLINSSDNVNIINKTNQVKLEPKIIPNKIPLKPLAPLAPKKQILPKLLPAQPKNGINTITSVNTSKQWVLPPRPRPGRKSTENSHSPLPSMASPDTLSSPNVQLQNSPPPTLPKKLTKIRKNVKSKKPASVLSNESVTTNTTKKESKGNFELRLQLQNATEENENLRKLINKLNREIDMLKLVKLENKRSNNLIKLNQLTTETNSILNELSTTIDPLKINCNLKSKRLKRFNSDSKTTSIGLNGNSLDDAGFYNADTLMPTDLLLSNITETKKPMKSTKLSKSKSLPMQPQIKPKQELCGFCSSGSPCVCYESTLDLLNNNQLLKIDNINKIDEKLIKNEKTKLINDLNKNFLKNELDVDMSFFVKQEEDIDDLMLM